VPTVEFPPAIPFTDQVTDVFFVPVTVAENCTVAPTRISAFEGATATSAAGASSEGLEPPARLQPVLKESASATIAIIAKNLAGNSFAILMVLIPLLDGPGWPSHPYVGATEFRMPTKPECTLAAD
jgi:hypothetical protein